MNFNRIVGWVVLGKNHRSSVTFQRFFWHTKFPYHGRLVVQKKKKTTANNNKGFIDGFANSTHPT